MHGTGMAFFSESLARAAATRLNDAVSPRDARLAVQASSEEVNAMLELFDGQPGVADPVAHLASLLGIEEGALREARARGTSFERFGQWFAALASTERASE